MLLIRFGCYSLQLSLCLYYSLSRLLCLLCLYRTRSFSRCWLLFRHFSLSLALSASRGRSLQFCLLFLACSSSDAVCSLQLCLLRLFLAHFPSRCCSRLFCLNRLFLARSASCCCSLPFRLLFLALSCSLSRSS